MNNQFDTPILFIIFNRPGFTQQVFNQIKQIKPKYLFVAADGPRQNVDGDVEKILESRRILQQIDWDCNVQTLFRDKNLGCKHSVSSAITWFFDQVDSGIILEDDSLPDLTFFPYCHELLLKYKDDEQVMMIGGSNFQNGIERGIGSYYFSNYAIIWGWATWKRAWDKYDLEMKDFHQTYYSGRIDHAFQNKKEKNHWKRVFTKTIDHQILTWCFPWLYCTWKNKGMSITPNKNLIVNIGTENDSTHQFLKDSYRDERKLESIYFPLKHPVKFEINKVADKFTFTNIFSHSFRRAFRLIRNNGLKTIIKLFYNYVTTKLLK